MYVFKQTNKKGWQRKTSQLQCPDGTVLTRRHFSSNEKRLPLLLVIWHRCSTVLAQAFCSTRDVLALGFFCLSYTLAVSSQADECARKCARVESWLALEGGHFTIFLPLGINWPMLKVNPSCLCHAHNLSCVLGVLVALLQHGIRVGMALPREAEGSFWRGKT